MGCPSTPGHPGVGATTDCPTWSTSDFLKVTRISAETTSLEDSVKPRLLGRFRVLARIGSQPGSGSINAPRNELCQPQIESPNEKQCRPTSRRRRCRTKVNSERSRRGRRWVGFQCRRRSGVGLWAGIPLREGGAELRQHSWEGRGHPDVGGAEAERRAETSRPWCSGFTAGLVSHALFSSS